MSPRPRPHATPRRIGLNCHHKDPCGFGIPLSRGQIRITPPGSCSFNESYSFETSPIERGANRIDRGVIDLDQDEIHIGMCFHDRAPPRQLLETGPARQTPDMNDPWRIALDRF
jgi:hypothetical protein